MKIKIEEIKILKFILLRDFYIGILENDIN